MSTSVEINGVSLVPLKQAAAEVSYSRDYVSRLAREGKIVASQIGRQWYVDLVSLQNFSLAAHVQENVRKQELSETRKNELYVKERLVELDERAQVKIKQHGLDAAVVTGAALCLGLVVGISLYSTSVFFAPTISSPDSLVARGSFPVTKEFAVSNELPPLPEEQKTMLFTTVMEQPVFIAEAETRRLSSTSEGVLVFAQGAVRDEEAVAALFSDDVAVTLAADGSGVISYGVGTEEVKQYPFVSVPSRYQNVATSTLEQQ